MTPLFVYTSEFDRLARGVLTDDDMRAVEERLLDNPRAGAVVAHTGGRAGVFPTFLSEEPTGLTV